MPQYKVEIPGQGAFNVESDRPLTDSEAYYAALKQLQPAEPSRPEAHPESGFVPALESGIAGLKGSAALTAGKLGLMNQDAAQKYYEEQVQHGKDVFAPTTESWSQAPFTKFKELAGSSLPYMVAPLIGAAAAPEAAAVGALGLGAGEVGAGLASLGQFTGTNLARQVDENKSLQNASLGSAAAAALPQAALDVFSLHMLPGVRSILGKAGIELTEQQAAQVAKQGLSQTLASYGGATLKAMGAEGLTEAAQQFFERLQAGLSINDPEARQEYYDNFLGGAVLGGALAPVGHAFERSAAKIQQPAPVRQPTQQPGVQAPAAQQPAEEVPEPTLRQPAPEEVAKGPAAPAVLTKQQKAEAARQKKDQEEYLRKYAQQAENRQAAIAEYQRVKDMSPEEYALEQMQGVTTVPKKVSPTVPQEDETGYYTQHPAPPAPHETYAAQQMALAKDREAAPQIKDYLDYLMQDPKQAQALLENRTQIPGVTAKQSEALLGGIKMQLKARADAAAKAEANRVSTAQERARGLFTQKPEDLLSSARAQPNFGKTLEEIQGIRRLGEGAPKTETTLPVVTTKNQGRLPIGHPARPARPEPTVTQGKLISERLKSAQEDLGEGAPEAEPHDEMVDKLVQSLPLANGQINPGDVYLGLGQKKQNYKDLQAQLAIARLTGNRALQGEIKRQLDATRPIPTEGGLGTEGGKNAAEIIGRSKLPELRVNEAEADQFASEQRNTLLGMARTLASKKIMLPGKRAELLSNAKEQYVAQHAAEIEARRKAFGLPPMEDWERAEARARALEGLNTLTNNWGQFEDPAISVKALQNITREAVYQNLFKAATRKAQTQQSTLAEKLAPPKTGPRIAAPDELTLRNEPRLATDTKQHALNMITMALREGRTRAVPTTTEKAPARVGSLADMAKLFGQEKGKEASAQTDAATKQFLEQLRDGLETNNDPEFVKLAAEQAQRVVEGNLPDEFAVRDLGEMMKAHEVAGRSATRPGATPEELQRTSAQPQRELFPEAGPEAEVQTQRATPSNFQKMLDSKNIQGLRDAIEKQRKDNLAALQGFGKAAPTLKNKVETAKNTYERNLKKLQKTVAVSNEFDREMQTDIAAATEAQAAWQKQVDDLREREAEVTAMRDALMQEPEDMSILISAPAVLNQEKAIRVALKRAEEGLATAKELTAAVQATNAAQMTLAKPAVDRAVKAEEDFKKAQAELAALQNEAAQKAQADAAAKAREENRQPEAERTAEEKRRAAIQRGREGLGLEGERVQRDNADIEKRAAQLRSAMGSLRDQIEKAKTEKRRAELQEKYDAKEEELNALPEKAPLVRTPIKDRTEADEAFERTQIKQARARNAKENLPSELPSARRGPIVKNVRTGRTSQVGQRKDVVGRADYVTDVMIRRRAELAALENQVAVLKENGKKVSSELREKVTKAEALFKNAQRIQGIIAKKEAAAGEELAKAKKAYGTAKDTYSKKAKGRLYSVGAVNSGLTAEQLQDELDKAIGGKNVTQQRVQVFNSVKDFYAKNNEHANNYPDVPENAKAFVDPETNKAFMFANNIGKGDGLGILLHEVGVHLGFRNLFSEKQFNTLVNAVKNWSVKNDGSLESRVARAAIERVETAKTSAEQYNDELLAYAVEEAAKAGVTPSVLSKGSPIKNWLSTVMDLLKKALSKFGINADKLTAGDLVNLAYGAAQLEVRGTWHGSDAAFTAFDVKQTGKGEGTYDRRFDGDYSLGAGPYVTPDKSYGEYYQHAVPMGKAANETGYGDKTYQDYRDMDYKFMTKSNEDLSVAALQNKYESILLTKYVSSVSAGDDLDPTKNKEVQRTLQRFEQMKDPRVVKALATLSPDKIKGFTERPPKGNLYRTLDDIPREKVFSVNSTATLGERPEIDALREKYGKTFVARKDGTKIDISLEDGKYPLNSLFYKMRRDLGIDETIALLKNAGIEAIEQINDGKYTERAYIDQAPQILAMNLEPVGPAKDLLFSKGAPTAKGFEDELGLAERIIADKPSMQQQIDANLGLNFRTKWLDRLAPLEKIAQTMMDPLKGTQMMYFLRMADQKMSFTQQAVANGVPEKVAYKRKDGQTEYVIESKKGANLADIAKTLGKAPDMNPAAANRLFTLYLAGKRAERVGADVLNMNVTDAELKNAISKIESNKELHNVFEDARNQYNEYNRNLVHFLQDMGVISKETAAKLSQSNDYIPYYRDHNGAAELVIGGEGTYRIGSLKDQPQLRELIGGNKKIFDFLTSSVQNTSMIMDMGLRNMATKNAMFQLQSLGMATFFGGEASGPNVVHFREDGKDRYVRVKTDAAGIPANLLVKGMEGIPVNNSALVKAMAMPATLLRRAVTVSPLYSARQIFRDSVAAPLTSGADFTPVMAAIKQIGKMDTKGTLESRGIVGGQVFTGGNEDLTRILGEFQSGKIGLSQLVAKAEAVAMEADALTRRAQYDSYIRQGLSEMEATLMSLESMNFNRKGMSPSVRLASTLIPFFNAQLQSLDVLYRAMTGKMPMNERLDIQGKLYRRGAALAGTAIAYTMLMQDDPLYKNAQPDEKYGNFFVHLPGMKEALRVPVPFEIGYIFKSIPEAIINSMASDAGAEDAYKAFKTIAIQTIPGATSGFMPAGVKPLVENATNHSFFTGRELESKAEQEREAQFRYRDSTSELAKGIGAITGTSPIKLENLIRGYTGTMGIAFTQAINAASPGNGVPEPTKKLSEMPVIGAAFQPEDAGGVVSDMYDHMARAREVQKTYNELVKEGNGAEARQYLQENVNMLATKTMTGNLQETMGKLKKAEMAIKASSLTPDEKRARLDEIQKMRIQIASNVRGVYEKTTPQ